MPTPNLEPTQRFTERVAFYVKYRPRYPRALLDYLADEAGLKAGAQVADIGSGTGFLSELFLWHGCTVYGIEPNAAMREAAEHLLAPFPGFHSIDGTAESTELPECSMDWIVAGQAFHWFEATAARAEFQRILRPDGRVAIVWNDRDVDGNPMMQAYDALLHRHAPEYKDVGHRRIDAVVYEQLFGHSNYVSATFPNEQRFDREALQGRLQSSSYTPKPGSPEAQVMLQELDQLFDAHAEDGTVAFRYVTRVFWGSLAQ